MKSVNRRTDNTTQLTKTQNNDLQNTS